MLGVSRNLHHEVKSVNDIVIKRCGCDKLRLTVWAGEFIRHKPWVVEPSMIPVSLGIADLSLLPVVFQVENIIVGTHIHENVVIRVLVSVA